MYRRYEPTARRSPPQVRGQGAAQQHSQSSRAEHPPDMRGNPRGNYQGNKTRQGHREEQPEKKPEQQKHAKKDETKKSPHLITKFIPQSIYNPETGKVFGVLSAEDLLIAALILLLIDSGEDDEDNSMLIYALLYILIADHIDLPF